MIGLMKKWKWTEEYDEYLWLKREKGESFRSIASMLGIAPGSAIARYKRLRLWRGLHPHQNSRKAA